MSFASELDGHFLLAPLIALVSGSIEDIQALSAAILQKTLLFLPTQHQFSLDKWTQVADSYAQIQVAEF